MKYVIVSVRDRAANAFGRPFFVATRGQAIRSFSDEVNTKREGNALQAHPEDFDLYELGVFDEDTGQFENNHVPTQIAVGKDVVR